MWRTLLVTGVMALVGAEAANPKPLTRAHAHNDYEHSRPLLDALDDGFGSVEADVHLIAGRLLIAHDPRELRPDRTLQSLYLDPLKKRVADNAGHVYPNGPPTFYLMIDVKSDAAATYTALKEALVPYHDLLTVFDKDKTRPGPITVIISGNRDRATMKSEDVRYAALDGTLSDLTANPSPPDSLVPWISAPWTKSFKWKGEGQIPLDELNKLKQFADRAHTQHRQLRFWDAPDNPTTWRVLYDANVDLINTDHLKECAQFLAAQP